MIAFGPVWAGGPKTGRLRIVMINPLKDRYELFDLAENWRLGRFTDTDRCGGRGAIGTGRSYPDRRQCGVKFGFLQSWGQALTNPLAGSPLKQKIRYVARETKLKLQFRLSI